MKKIFAVIIIFICIYALNLTGDNMNNTYKIFNKERYDEYKIKNPNLSDEEIIKRVNLNLDYEFYENVSDALNLDTNLVLVNKYYKLDKDYVPKNLVQIDYKYTSGLDIYADKDAVSNFINMCIDASTINLTIKTISAYRSYEYQKNLYDKYLLEDELNIVDTYSARAGHSEHQTGLAFDIYNVKKSYTEFKETNEYKWVKDNAHRYGFIIRYTKEFEYITGYKSEEWHIRYVGIDASTYIYNHNITLEEYILNKK